MWITRPIVAFLSGGVFVLSVLLTTIGTAILLGVDIPALSLLTQAEVKIVVTTATVLLLFSASLYTFQRFSVIQDLRRKLDDKRDLQRRIDQLARLRSRAINRIYAKTPKPDNFKAWVQEHQSWKKEVNAFLEENFPFAVVEMFADLGAIIPYDFQHASEDPNIRQRHIKILQMLVKELTIIERLIRENTFLTLEAQPSFLELVKWQETS